MPADERAADERAADARAADERAAANRELVRRFVHEVFQEGRLEAIDELVAPSFASSSFGIGSRDELRSATERIHASLSDVRFTVDEMLVEGDRVAARLTARATATGDFMGVPAAGKSYEIVEVHFFGVADGRVAEHWHLHDVAALMLQLGADGQASPARG